MFRVGRSIGGSYEGQECEKNAWKGPPEEEKRGKSADGIDHPVAREPDAGRGGMARIACGDANERVRHSIRISGRSGEALKEMLRRP